jgi:hypothetical protein
MGVVSCLMLFGPFSYGCGLPMSAAVAAASVEAATTTVEAATASATMTTTSALRKC